MTARGTKPSSPRAAEPLDFLPGFWKNSSCGSFNDAYTTSQELPRSPSPGHLQGGIIAQPDRLLRDAQVRRALSVLQLHRSASATPT
ncbi:hypothetical protein ACRAWD_01000 [Caulobacter segnis]